MITKIKDGAGTSVRAAVFDKRMREYQVQQSATNHISTADLGGRTGTFTVRLSFNVNFSGANQKYNLFFLTNNDPFNLLIINRTYIQIVKSDITLPDPNFIATIENFSISLNPIVIINENRFISTGLLLTTGSSTGPTATTQIPSNDSMRMCPTLGDIIELIVPGSNGLILNGAPNPVTSQGNNAINMPIYNNTGLSGNVLVNSFMKFMMVPPDQLG